MRWTPPYCPDGSIAFTSDRSAHSPSCDSYCNDLTDHNLYLLTPDRKHIRRLTSVTNVKQFGSHRSKLILNLLKGHQKVKLSESEWIALVTWVDANAPYQDKMLNKRPKGGGKDRWELYPWKDPWGPSVVVPAKGRISLSGKMK